MKMHHWILIVLVAAVVYYFLVKRGTLGKPNLSLFTNPAQAA